MGTIGDLRPGYVASPLHDRGFKQDTAYITCQIVITKDLRRTGGPAT